MQETTTITTPSCRHCGETSTFEITVQESDDLWFNSLPPRHLSKMEKLSWNEKQDGTHVDCHMMVYWYDFEDDPLDAEVQENHDMSSEGYL